MAAICPEVGAGFSTGSSPIFVGLPAEDEDELELLFVFNLLVRLHAATTRTRAIIASTFFIGLFILPGSETQTPFTSTLDASQMCGLQIESLACYSWSRSPSARPYHDVNSPRCWQEVCYAKNRIKTCI